jgi:hypothetical protein
MVWLGSSPEVVLQDLELEDLVIPPAQCNSPFTTKKKEKKRKERESQMNQKVHVFGSRRDHKSCEVRK